MKNKNIFVMLALLIFLLTSCGEVKDNNDDTLSWSTWEIVDETTNWNTWTEVNSDTWSLEDWDLDKTINNSDSDEKDISVDSDTSTWSILTGTWDEDLSEEEIVKEFDKALDDIISDMLKDESN